MTSRRSGMIFLCNNFTKLSIIENLYPFFYIVIFLFEILYFAAPPPGAPKVWIVISENLAFWISGKGCTMHIHTVESSCNCFLKGVFAKNERGYRLNAIKKRVWSLINLLLSVASIIRKLLKTSHTEYLSAHTNSEIATYNLDRKKSI